MPDPWLGRKPETKGEDEAAPPLRMLATQTLTADTPRQDRTRIHCSASIIKQTIQSDQVKLSQRLHQFEIKLKPAAANQKSNPIKLS